jgi:Zn-dependent protease
MSIILTIVLVVILFLSIVLHEYAHGFIAHKLGDPTPKEAGRLTLNPLKHIDLFGTVLLPILLLLISRGVFSFGYAKPVPINPYYFKYPRKDVCWVALAGPSANLCLALLLRAVLFVLPSAAAEIVLQALAMNLILVVFNLIPIPPLDGSRILSVLLPHKISYKYLKLDMVGSFVIVVLLITGFFKWCIWPIVSSALSLMGVYVEL